MQKAEKLILFVLQIAMLLQITIAQYYCRTPGYKMGICMSIYECDYLLNILKSRSLTQQSVTFLKMSQCDGDSSSNAPHVCCARNDESLNWRPAPTKTSSSHERSFSAQSSQNFAVSNEHQDGSIAYKTVGTNNLLPKGGECGREFIENRIYNGQDAKREEFPWLALLEYRKITGELSINCAGSLISKHYVLTAGHCLTGDIISRVGSLVNVRLGDHDLKSSSGNPHRTNEIAEIIPHENFNPRAPNRRHDIGLIRLRTAMHYTSTVRPICLPNQSTPSMKIGESVYVAGFGRTLQAKMSTIKQKLTIPIYDQSSCRRKFATKNIKVENDQLCAGGEFSKDTCDGDSGGPLMRFRDSWTLEGIVSFGYLCGLEGWPAIYTRVSSYSTWINSHLQP